MAPVRNNNDGTRFNSGLIFKILFADFVVINFQISVWLGFYWAEPGDCDVWLAVEIK